MINKFENLESWKLSRKLATDIYKLVRKYPPSEIYSLVSQTTRATISMSANIAEGSSRSSRKDFNHFLEIALGSGFELVTLISIALDLKYITQEECQQISDQVLQIIKLIYGLKRRICV